MRSPPAQSRSQAPAGSRNSTALTARLAPTRNPSRTSRMCPADDSLELPDAPDHEGSVDHFPDPFVIERIRIDHDARPEGARTDIGDLIKLDTSPDGEAAPTSRCS